TNNETNANCRFMDSPDAWIAHGDFTSHSSPPSLARAIRDVRPIALQLSARRHRVRGSPDDIPGCTLPPDRAQPAHRHHPNLLLCAPGKSSFHSARPTLSALAAPMRRRLTVCRVAPPLSLCLNKWAARSRLICAVSRVAQERK